MFFDFVSTHSRLKAAGWIYSLRVVHLTRFNTQPPEGGWAVINNMAIIFDTFQHTAA